MNKEYFKILKEINSLERDISVLEGENQEETYRVDKLKGRQEEAANELAQTKSELKDKKLESQKNENQIVSADAKLNKAQADLRAAFDAKQAEALEREIARLEDELETAQDRGLELLEQIDELEQIKSEKEEFLSGIAETIEEIKNEVGELAAKNQVQIDSKSKRIDSALAELPENFKRVYETAQSKDLAVSSFSKILAGKCAVCQMSVDKTKESQVEDQLAIKTCSSCGRVFIPNQALY